MPGPHPLAPKEAIREEASIVFADLCALYELERYRIFDDFRDAFFGFAEEVVERLTRSLIKLAAVARAEDDLAGGLAEHARRRPRGVGEIMIADGHPEPLSAREACNKIIHAQSIEFELEQLPDHFLHQHLLERDFGRFEESFHRPTIVTCGERRKGEPWEARIDSMRWIHAIMHF